jgi:hypothetical protein
VGQVKSFRLVLLALVAVAAGAAATAAAQALLPTLDTPTSDVTTTTFQRLWFGPSAAPGKIQVDGLTHILASEGADKATQTMALGENYPHGSGWASDVGRAYISTLSSPYRLIRIDPDNLSEYSVYTAPTRANGRSLVIDEGRVYVGCSYMGYIYIDEFDTTSSPPSLLSSHGFGNGYGSDIESLAGDGSYLYVATDGRYVLKIRIADWHIVASTQPTDLGTNMLHAIAYDPEYDYIYSTTGSSQKYIYRFDASDLGNETYQELDGPATDDIAVVPGYVYVGYESTGVQGGTVAKIPKADMGSYINIRAGPDAFCYGVFAEPSQDYVWAAWASSPGELTRIRVSDNAQQRFWLASDENKASEVVFCGGLDKMLVTCWAHQPFKTVRITDPIADEPCQRSDLETRRSYWYPIRLYAEDTPGGTIDSLEVHSDGTTGLGAGVELKGNTATSYVQPTGSAGQGGDELNTTNYDTLADHPEDVFEWTESSPKSISGSGNDKGDIGDFLVLQLLFGSSASDGQTGEEALTFSHVEDGWPGQAQATFYGLLNTQPDNNAPVGGIAELPEVAGSSGRNYAALAALAPAALVALGGGAWYARGRWLG